MLRDLNVRYLLVLCGISAGMQMNPACLLTKTGISVKITRIARYGAI